jgi:hypothetical protein
MNQGLSYFFCMMIEGSGSGSIPLVDPDPGGLKTCGSDGSGFGSATLLYSRLDRIKVINLEL